MLRALAGFKANAQSQSQCCFWLENLQPDTVQDISNLDLPTGSTAALLPGNGNSLILSNNLSTVNSAPYHDEVSGQNLSTRVYERTDWYQLHIDGNCGDASTKVSLEWKLYKDGVLLTDANVGNYADIYIFTRFDQLAHTNSVYATLGHEGWLGGQMYGPGTCATLPTTCIGGYPGSAAEVVFSYFPYAEEGYTTDGYVSFANSYNLDYFYLGFLQSTETRIAINWKQVGNYSLVVSLRERTNGTDYAIWQNDNQNSYIGGHQSICGGILASDSLTYPVWTSSQYAVCENDSTAYSYGRPTANYTDTGTYYVLFGENVCGHWEVDSIDVFSYYKRINPNITAHDSTVCKNELVSDADFAALAPAVDTTAPGYIGHEIYWRSDDLGEFSTTIPDHPTDVPGTYTYYVYQTNHYDAVTGQDFWCSGDTATFTFVVLDVLSPILYDTQDSIAFCFSVLPADVTLQARLNEENSCADNIHWFLGTSATGTPVSTNALNDGISSFATTISATSNANDTITYTAFSYDASTNTYSTEGVSVSIYIWKNPELVAKTDTSLVVCPNSSVTLNSEFSSSNFDNDELTWIYVWTKNGSTMMNSESSIEVEAPGCSVTDTYTVTATATSAHGCEATISRQFTVTGNDTSSLSIAWRDTSSSELTISGCDTTSTDWTTPYTLSNASQDTTGTSAILIKTDHCSNASSLVYTATVDATAAPCSTSVTRSYYLMDSCGNISNTISQVVTIKNNIYPTIAGGTIELDPVRPLNNDCKSNLPTRSDLLSAFHANHTITTGCGATVSDDNIIFYMGNTTVVADSNADIFASTDTVVIYAQVTDICGNVSDMTKVFVLYKPASIDITHGSIITASNELCNTDTATVVFDPLMIRDGLAPYVYTWSQTPVPEEAGYTLSADSLSLNAWALQTGAYNTSVQFIITVVDAYGCVATDTSNAIRWYGIPDVTINENTANDNYPHTSPVVVCPTFGHYLLTAVGNANLPESSTLTYVWSGEAIDYTSTTSDCFIAVSESTCSRDYEATVTVTNAKGCSATASYTIKAEDTEAPVITLDMSTDTIYNLNSNCQIIIPDYTQYFTQSTVSDNCWNMDNIIVTQDIPVNTTVSVNTDVTITVTPSCGPTATYVIKACFPEPRISTQISATTDSACFPYTTTFTTTTVDYTGALQTYWDGATTSAESLTFTTTSETDNLIHTVTVVDENGCTATDSDTLTVYHTPVASDVTIETTPNHYCGTDNYDGTYTITANNTEIVGVREHGTDDWHALPYTATEVPDGTYTFDLLTTNGCVTEEIGRAEVLHDTTDTYLALSLQIITDNANCVAPWSGTIQVNNPVQGYSYYISERDEYSSDDTISSGNYTIVYDPSMLGHVLFNYLYQGTYIVTVTSTYNCHASDTIVVADDQTIPVIPSWTATANTSCSNQNGSLTLSNTNQDWWYSISGQEIRGTNGDISFTNLAGGNYLLTVINKSTNCSDTATVTVPDNSSAPTIPSITLTNNSYCVGSNGSVELSTVVSDYTYTLTSTDSTYSATLMSGSSFTGLAAGTYVLTVSDPTSGCLSTSGVLTIVDERADPSFDIAITPRTTCDHTLANGSISNFPSGYTYEVRNSYDSVVTNYTTLDSGYYAMTLTNTETGCVYNKTVHVDYEEPTVTLDVTVTEDNDCSAVGTGVASVTTIPAIIAGTITYTVLDTSNNVADMNALNEGSYTITALVSSTGCSYSGEFSIQGNYTYPSLSATTTANYICDTNMNKNGTITITDNNTSSDYSSVTYYVDGVEVTNPVTNVDGGTYTITAITNYHCEATITVTVVDSAFVIRAFDVVANSVCDPSESKPGNGQITVVTPQDTLCSYVFTYLDSDGSDTTVYDVNHFEPLSYTKYTLSDGWYRIQITDSRTGCSSTDSVEVPYEPIEVTINAIAVTPDYYCTTGTGNGTIGVNASSESVASVLEYSLDGTTYQSSNLFTNLDEGTYPIYVRDATTNCVYDALADAVTVESATYDINVTFNNVANTACDPTLYNGEVHATVTYADASLGTGSFTVAIEGGSFTGLNEGRYGLTITDDVTGCEYTNTATVVNDSVYTPLISVNASNNNGHASGYHFCYGATDAYMIASATTALEGDTNFTYVWTYCYNPDASDTNARVHVNTIQTYYNCNYTVTATSALTGCSNTIVIPVTVNELPTVNFVMTREGDIVTPVTTTPNVRYENCANKGFTMCVEGNNNGFQYSWTNGNNESISTEACFIVDTGSIDDEGNSYIVQVVDSNGCASGYIPVSVTTLPISTSEETIIACGEYTFTSSTSQDSTFNYTGSGENTHVMVDTLDAVNGCDSIVTYTIIIETRPELNLAINSSPSQPYCVGYFISTTVDTGYTAENADFSGLRIVDADITVGKSNFLTAGEVFDPTAPLTYGMNGKYVYAYAYNSCDTVIRTSTYTLTVNDVPSLDEANRTLKDTTICLGSEALYDASSINNIDWHGSVGTVTVQYSRDGGSSWDTLENSVYPALEDNFKIRILASNSCGYVVVDGPVTITVVAPPYLAVTNSEQNVCENSAITPIVISYANATLDNTIDLSGINLSATTVSGDTTTITISGIPTADTTFNITATGDSPCGYTAQSVKISINGSVSISCASDYLNQTICVGSSITDILLAVTNGQIDSVVGLPSGLSFNANTIFGTVSTSVTAGTYNYAIYASSSNQSCPSYDTLTGTITVVDPVRLTLATGSGDTSQTLCITNPTINNIVFSVENASSLSLTNGRLPDGVSLNGSTISGTATESGQISYTVTAESAGDCPPQSITGTITIDPEVDLTVTNAEQNICSGTGITEIEISSNNANLTFDPAEITGLTMNSTSITGGSQLSVGTHTINVTATSTNSCPDKNATISITVHSPVSLTATGDTTQTICLGDTISDIVLTVEHASSVNVALPAGVTFDSTTNKIFGTPTNYGTSTYSIVATSEYCDDDVTITGTITVNDIVTFKTVDDTVQTVCLGDSIDTIRFTVKNVEISISDNRPDGLTFGFIDNEYVICGVPTNLDTNGTTFTVTATKSDESICGDVVSISVTIKVNDAPSITTDTSIRVCVGDSLYEPTVEYNANGSQDISTGWYYNDYETAFTWPATAVETMNGDTLYYVVSGSCGADTLAIPIIVDSLPVPAISSDAKICEDSTITLTATTGYASYQWYMDGTKITSDTNSSYVFDPTAAGAGAGTFTFTVKVTDGNGCTSVETENGTTDTRYFSVDNAVTIVVNNNPGFVFTDNSGNETHEINATTADASTTYTWMVGNDCEYNSNTLVFVNFDIYYNGELIPDDSIGLYIQSQTHNMDAYVTTDAFEWSTFSGVPQSYTCYYNYAQSNNGESVYLHSNHFPAGNLGYASATFDDFYLHFLTDRGVTKTINQFRRAGTYTIVYTLYSTSNTDTYNHLYQVVADSSNSIGGFNSIISGATLTQLAYDELTINVTGDDNVVANAPDVAPTLTTISSYDNAPTMEVYPNPAHSGTQVKARIQGINGKTTVRIINISGKVLDQESVMISTSDYLYTRDISNLAPGIYFIYVEGENASISKKLIITK